MWLREWTLKCIIYTDCPWCCLVIWKKRRLGKNAFALIVAFSSLTWNIYRNRLLAKILPLEAKLHQQVHDYLMLVSEGRVRYCGQQIPAALKIRLLRWSRPVSHQPLTAGTGPVCAFWPAEEDRQCQYVVWVHQTVSPMGFLFDEGWFVSRDAGICFVIFPGGRLPDLAGRRIKSWGIGCVQWTQQLWSPG